MRVTDLQLPTLLVCCVLCVLLRIIASSIYAWQRKLVFHALAHRVLDGMGMRLTDLQLPGRPVRSSR